MPQFDFDLGGATGIQMGATPGAVNPWPYPNGATPITASATGTTGAVTATLAAAVGKFTYITSAVFCFSNPTTAITVTPTISGLVTTTLSYTMQILAAAATVLPPYPLELTFSPPVPGNGVNTAIIATLPALGTGATGASVALTGFQL